MRIARPLFPTLALAFSVAAAGCGSDPAPTAPVVAATVETTQFAPALGVDLTAAGWTRSNTGLYSRTLAEAPAGAAVVAAGRQVTVGYTLWLSNGQQLESNTISGLPIGTGQVIAGWDEGIVGMRVGEKRRLLIPPSLGYGPTAYRGIPGNSVLVFDVQVVSSP